MPDPSSASPNAGLPGFLTFDQWRKPSQAKWFKQGTAQQGADPQDVYARWLQMLQQRSAAPTPTTGGGVQAPRRRGGGRQGGAGGATAAPGGKPGGPRGNHANVGAPPPAAPTPDWSKGGITSPGGATIASQNRVQPTPITGPGLQAPPQQGAENPALAAIRQLLMRLQGNQGYRGAGMGGKG